MTEIILGVQDLKVPVWEFNVPLMVNQLTWSSIPWDNKTWVDSGGFQILMHGRHVKLEDVIRKYKTLDADYYVSLDIPSAPCSAPDPRNFENFVELYTQLDVKLVPVIHTYDPDNLVKALDFYSMYVDTIAFGGVVPSTLNRGGDVYVTLSAYKFLRRNFRGKIHVLGVGAPSIRVLFHDADSVDTMTYRVRAIRRIVMLPWGGERYVGTRKLKWHTKYITSDELEMLMSFLDITRYPYDVDFDDWVSIAMLNAWVVLHGFGAPRGKLVEYVNGLKGEIEEVEIACEKFNSRADKL